MALASAHAESQKNGEPGPSPAPAAPTAPTECARFLLSAAFAFLAGYADVLSVRIYSVFATMMTGNAFMMGSELVTGEKIQWYTPWDAKNVPVRAWVFRVVVITAFCVGLLAVEFVSARVKRFGAATILAPPIGATTLLVSLFLPEAKRWHVVALALIFGVQHGVCSRGFGGVTTMVTGHLAKLAKELTKIRSRDDAAALGHRDLLSIASVISIVIGAAFGQWSVQMYQEGKIGALFAWVGPVMAVLLVINDHIFHDGDVDVIRAAESEALLLSRALTGYGTVAGTNRGDVDAHPAHEKLDA